MTVWQLNKNRKQLFAYRSVFIPFCLFFLFIAVDAKTYAERTVERNNQQAISRIKTAYIYNFLKYIELQNNMPEKTETFRVCVYGKNPFGEALHNMNGRQAKGILVKVVKIEEVEQARSCHIVYISESESNNIAALLSAIRAQAILTVSDINNFSNIGGIIGFTQVKEKIGIEINLNNAQKAKVKISALLLEIAKIIE